ncbi:MAG: CoA transferase [Maricaulaceae bacterium]|nr:CoA transferase [Maricaulaceae bacterium]
MSGPLQGIRVVEMTGLGPCPMAGQWLADLGAGVICIDRRAEPALPERPKDANRRGKRSIALNLKQADAVTAAKTLISQADILIEGFRPGVMERFGLGPEAMLAANPKLVYGRLTGWGQTGPLAPRAGHDITYAAIAGVLHGVGPKSQPVPPLNIAADYAGGSAFLVIGVLAALLRARETGAGQVVDAAMTEGAAALTSLFHSLLAAGVWKDAREANIIDGGAPFYGVYECAGGGHVAVGPLEPQFFAELVDGLGLDPEWKQAQYDQTRWAELKALLAETFKTRTRDDWAARFETSDACVAPVLSLREAPAHPHNLARESFAFREGYPQPAPAPRFSRDAPQIARPPCFMGEHGAEVLTEAGFDADFINALRASGALLEA